MKYYIGSGSSSPINISGNTSINKTQESFPYICKGGSNSYNSINGGSYGGGAGYHDLGNSFDAHGKILKGNGRQGDDDQGLEAVYRSGRKSDIEKTNCPFVLTEAEPRNPSLLAGSGAGGIIVTKYPGNDTSEHGSGGDIYVSTFGLPGIICICKQYVNWD